MLWFRMDCYVLAYVMLFRMDHICYVLAYVLKIQNRSKNSVQIQNCYFLLCPIAYMHCFDLFHDPIHGFCYGIHIYLIRLICYDQIQMLKQLVQMKELCICSCYDLLMLCSCYYLLLLFETILFLHRYGLPMNIEHWILRTKS